MTGFVSLPNQTDFYWQVWELVRQIPSGKVSTYGQIAEMLPIPDGVDDKTYGAYSARWVGGAMAACPSDVPWHRVVNAQGRISPRKSGGHLKQREFLESEGVVFDRSGRIDLTRYIWGGIQREDRG